MKKNIKIKVGDTVRVDGRSDEFVVTYLAHDFATVLKYTNEEIRHLTVSLNQLKLVSQAKKKNYCEACGEKE